MEWETRTQKVQGLRTNYAVAGSGPPVILIHGMGACHVTWYENIGPLSQHFTVYALDLPAHGDSENPSRGVFNTPAGAQFIRQFMDRLRIRRASLIGNSAGGGIAAMFAIGNPSRVERLVLVDSSGLGRPVAWFLRLTSVPLVGELLHLCTGNGEKTLISSIFHRPRPLKPEVSRQLLDTRNRWSTRMRVVQSIRSGVGLLGTRKRLQLVERLRELEIPLLVVWGEHDRVLPVSHAYEAARELPNAVVHIMRDCGHWPHMERPQEFNRLVETFLERPDSARELLDQESWS